MSTPQTAAAPSIDHLLLQSLPKLRGDISRESWPDRVNQGVALDWGFDFGAVGRFEGAITHHRFGGLRSFSVACEPHLVYRKAAHVADGASYYLLSLQVTGFKHVEQHGRRVRLDAGHFALYDSDAPVGLEVGRAYRSVNVRFPKTAVTAAERESIAELLVQPLSLRDGMAPVVWTMLMSLEQHADALGERTQALGEHAVGMTALMLTSHPLIADRPERMIGSAATRLVEVQAWIEDRLGDTTLSAETIASANFISVRTLHKTFADAGISVAAWTRSRRIAAVQRELADRTNSDTIASIGARYGFTAVSHFSWLFKQHTGLTPSEFRERSAR